MFCNMVIFYSEELLAPRPTPKLEDHPLLAVCDCLLNVFAATLLIRRPFLHPQPEDAPCSGDRDPLMSTYLNITVTQRTEAVHLSKTSFQTYDPVPRVPNMSYLWFLSYRFFYLIGQHTLYQASRP
jgi:hypothetical protein